MLYTAGNPNQSGRRSEPLVCRPRAASKLPTPRDMLPHPPDYIARRYTRSHQPPRAICTSETRPGCVCPGEQERGRGVFLWKVEQGGGFRGCGCGRYIAIGVIYDGCGPAAFFPRC